MTPLAPDRCVPDATTTHWRQGARWLGWRSDSEIMLVVTLWAPHGLSVPREWADRVLWASEEANGR